MNRPIRLRLTSILSFLLLFSIYSSATSYYVSTSGSDTNTGSISAPYATVQYGFNQLTPGDSLLLRGGTYFEKIYCNVSGTIGSPITITNYLSEEAIIDGTGVTGLELLAINTKSYVNIDGLIFQNNYVQDARAILVTSEASGIHISNCTVRNIGWTTDSIADPYSVSPTGQAHAIIFNGRTTNGITDISITDCHIHDIISGNSEALTLVGNVSNFEIARDTVNDTKNIGIVVAGHYAWAVDSGVDASLNQSRNGVITECVVYSNRRFSNFDAPAGIYADGAKNVVISKNYSYDNGNGMSVGCENSGFSADSITVVNNVIYDNDNQGIYFGSNAASLTNSLLKNNTFFHNGKFDLFRSEISLQNSSNCKIIQNILIPRSISHYAAAIFGYTVTDLIVDNNLAYRYDGSTSNLFIPSDPPQFSDTNTIISDPEFVDTMLASLDLTLTSASPAIDQGLKDYGIIQSIDIKNNNRIVNGKLDHGALESINGNCPSILTLTEDHILSGKFTASSEIILNISAGNITDPMELFAPTITTSASLYLFSSVAVDPNGCSN